MAEALLEAADDAALALSADAVWKRLQPRLDERLSASKSAQSQKSYSTSKGRKSGKSSGQDSTLPLSKTAPMAVTRF